MFSLLGLDPSITLSSSRGLHPRVGGARLRGQRPEEEEVVR